MYMYIYTYIYTYIIYIYIYKSICYVRHDKTKNYCKE